MSSRPYAQQSATRIDDDDELVLKHAAVDSKGHNELIQEKSVLDILGIVKQKVTSSGLVCRFLKLLVKRQSFKLLQQQFFARGTFFNQRARENRMFHPGLLHVFAVKVLINLILFLQNCAYT